MKKTINIQKATDFERKQNSSALNNLCFGYYETNIRAVELTMKADGVYCGFTKDEFLAKLHSRFVAIKDADCFKLQLDHGLALNGLAGAQMAKIQFFLFESKEDKMNGWPIKKEISMKFAFKFEAGLISQIEHCSCFKLFSSPIVDLIPYYLN